MKKRNIIVVGASAGGLAAMQKLVETLPADLDAAIFIVWHMAPDIKGKLPDVLNRSGRILAAHAIDREPILYNRIYIAPPDKHLTIEKDCVRVTHGPKENRFRPAVDPLFRSAAHAFGPRVIGVILSGALDDGTAGLWMISRYGGTCIVQDPKEAGHPSMPQNALNAVAVDYKLPVAKMASVITKLVNTEAGIIKKKKIAEDKRTALEVNIARQDEALERGILGFGEFTPYTCPECNGVLSLFRDGSIVRYRCHTGHAYSTDSLLVSITERIEESLWSTIRGMEEAILLLNNLGDHFATHNKPRMAAAYFKKSKDVAERMKLLREAVLAHQQLSPEGIIEEEVTGKELIKNKEINIE